MHVMSLRGSLCAACVLCYAYQHQQGQHNPVQRCAVRKRVRGRALGDGQHRTISPLALLVQRNDPFPSQPHFLTTTEGFEEMIMILPIQPFRIQMLPVVTVGTRLHRAKTPMYVCSASAKGIQGIQGLRTNEGAFESMRLELAPREK